MKISKFGWSVVAALTLSTSLAQADPAAAPAPAPLATPAMTGPLTANPGPSSFDSGYGTIYYGGVISGLGYYQSNATHGFPGNGSSGVDLSNGQAFIEKTDGLFQFYLQAGEYSLPSVGAGYVRSSQLTSHTFGVVPVGYLKIAPSDSWSIEIGKLPTLIGAEYTFTFENMNIERGLLWNQEPAISRGIQLNYASGPLSVQLSLNDGYYSNRYNWVSGLASYAFDSTNTLAFAAGGNFGKSGTSTFVTPFFLNNSSIYNLIYTYNSAPWLISPYVQYQVVHKENSLFIVNSSSDWGFGVLANYTISPTWNLSGRVEYETSSGGNFFEFPLGYGQGSKAWSFTITPTWQINRFFIRGEASYTTLNHATPGLEFGNAFDKSAQTRVMVETGFVL